MFLSHRYPSLDLNLLSYRARTPAGNEDRMPPLAPGDEHQNIIGRPHDGSQRLLVGAVHPARPEIFLVLGTVHAIVLQLSEWLTRLFPQIIFDVALSPVVLRNAHRMFRTQHHHGVAHHVKVIVPGAFHGAGNAVENLKGVALGVVVNVMGWLTGVCRDGAFLGSKTPLDVERFPGRLFFIFRPEISVLARMAEGGLVRFPRDTSPEVHHDEP